LYSVTGLNIEFIDYILHIPLCCYSSTKCIHAMKVIIAICYSSCSNYETGRVFLL